MGLFHPWQLVWLVLAAVVVWFYFSGRRRAVDVSSHVLWRRTLEKQSAWRRWQRSVSAAMMAALVAALAFAVAEPYWHSDRAAARTILVVLEKGGHVQGDTAPASPDALASSRSAALAVVDGMKLYERMAIVGTGGAPHVVSPLTGDRAKLRRVITSVSAVEGPDSTARATDLANWMIAAEQNAEVVVVTADGQSRGGGGVRSGGRDEPPGAWLLLAAVVVCGGEWLLFSRRITV